MSWWKIWSSAICFGLAFFFLGPGNVSYGYCSIQSDCEKKNLILPLIKQGFETVKKKQKKNLYFKATIKEKP